MSLCHGPPAKCVIHSFVGVGFQKLLHLSEWIEWSGVLSFGSSGNLFFCCDIVYVPRVPPDSRSHTPFASYWPLGGVNWTISDPRLFKSGLNFPNLMCQLVKISNMGLILSMSTLWNFKFGKLRLLWNKKLSNWHPLLAILTMSRNFDLFSQKSTNSFLPHFKSVTNFTLLLFCSLLYIFFHCFR